MMGAGGWSMRFPIIFTLLLFVGAAHALPFSEWTDNQAAGKCRGDLRRAYGDTLSVVSFMGKQPHEDNTTLVGLVASDGRTEFKGQQVVVGCIYKQDASLVTIFFNSKIANWIAPKRATALSKRPASQSTSISSTGGYSLSIPSDPRAQYHVLGKGGTHNNPTLVTKRIGSSGTSYSEWLFDCSASKAKYLGHGDTLEEMQASSPYNSEMGPIVEESITWYAWRHACTNTSVPRNPANEQLMSYPEADRPLYLAMVIRNGGDQCTPSGAAYRGAHTDGSVFYHVMCMEGENYMVMIQADSEGTASALACGFFRLTGGDCAKNL